MNTHIAIPISVLWFLFHIFCSSAALAQESYEDELDTAMDGLEDIAADDSSYLYRAGYRFAPLRTVSRPVFSAWGMTCSAVLKMAATPHPCMQ